MASNGSSYKDYHESYMSNHSGTSMWECLFLILPSPFFVFFAAYILQVYNISRNSLTAFLIEFPLLIIPVTLTYTIYNAYSDIVFYITILCYVVLFLLILRRGSKTILKIAFSLVIPEQKKFSITLFRSITSLLTALCILAVDFKIFPRRFAKTESYGFSLMDVGVGFYVVSSGIVVKSNIRDHLVKSIKSSLPLIILGILRYVSVKSLDYQEHVSEYGLYWNFFFTLAVIKLVCPLILANWPNGALWSSIILALMHQLTLSSGFEDWIMTDNTRDTIISANKEGIFSLPGYLSLYMAAIYIGRVVSTNYVDLQADLIKSLKLFIASGIFFIVTLYFNPTIKVSRRLISITYLTYILGFTLVILGICSLLEISIRIINFILGKKSNDNIVPLFLEAINFNSLAFFLLANLMTGLINICVKTLYVDPLPSLAILYNYMLFICFVTCCLYKSKIKLSL